MRSTNRTNRSPHVRRWAGVVLTLLAAACTDRPPSTAPPIEGRRVEAPPAPRIDDDARASMGDAIDRVLPSLDPAAVPSGLAQALRALSDDMDAGESGAARAQLRRAQSAIDAYVLNAPAAATAELDAIALALAAVERALRDAA
jgi:hypothetical protein